MSAVAVEADSRTPLMQLNGVTKRFGGLVALNNVSFALMPGEIIGLIGPNGAGKTTLVNVITGMQQANSGEIFFRVRQFSGFRPIRSQGAESGARSRSFSHFRA